MNPQAPHTLPTTREKLLKNARQLARNFEPIANNAPYEAKGVLFSEILFVLAAAWPDVPTRIFESGRAAGVSTYPLSASFPNSQIISIERDPHSPDVALAQDNLQKCPNLRCLFGDSRKLLLAQVQPEDFVVIDGPKEIRALKLAFRLLWKRRPRALFIHDCCRGSIERAVLENLYPRCLFSDDPEFVQDFQYLDQRCWNKMETLCQEGLRLPHLEKSSKPSYGPTFALLQPRTALPFPLILFLLFFLELGLKIRCFVLHFLPKTLGNALA